LLWKAKAALAECCSKEHRAAKSAAIHYVALMRMSEAFNLTGTVLRATADKLMEKLCVFKQANVGWL